MLITDLQASEYHSYYRHYIECLEVAELQVLLKEGKDLFSNFIRLIPESKKNFSYQDGKWSVSEVLQHLIDSERVFQYRGLRFSRGDKTPLPGFDQDNYVPESKANEKTLSSIHDEFIAVRDSSISLFSSFGDAELKRRGMASEAPMSVRALGFVICGHQEHHRRILEERYF